MREAELNGNETKRESMRRSESQKREREEEER